MNDAMKQSIFSLVRSSLIAIGTWLVARGLVDDPMMQTVVTALMVVVSAAWGVAQKFWSEDNTQAREVVAVNVGIIKADNTAGPTKLATAETAPALIESLAPNVPQGHSP